jgi:hypothetical protein
MSIVVLFLMIERERDRERDRGERERDKEREVGREGDNASYVTPVWHRKSCRPSSLRLARTECS